MYLMVEIDPSKFIDIKDDREFSIKLLNEELVYVLPGQCFNAVNFFRIVFCAPKKELGEACNRIRNFCNRHALLDYKNGVPIKSGVKIETKYNEDINHTNDNTSVEEEDGKKGKSNIDKTKTNGHKKKNKKNKTNVDTSI